jgi:hypothetical protein
MSGLTAGISYAPALGPPTSIEFGTTDALGVRWIVADLEGDEGPPMHGQVVASAGDHGGWATPQFAGPRLMTLTLQVIAPTPAARDVARAQVAMAFPLSDLATLRIDESIPKQMLVRRSGEIPGPKSADCDVRLIIGLVAPDPRKYGTVLHTATATQASPAAGLAPPLTPPLTLPAGAPPMAVACTNSGSFETRPTVTITGPITGPAVVNQTTGAAVTFSGMTLAASDQLVVDLLAKQSYLNGVFRTADISSSWWSLPQNTSTTVQVTGTGATGSTMTVAWRDAWI